MPSSATANPNPTSRPLGPDGAREGAGTGRGEAATGAGRAGVAMADDGAAGAGLGAAGAAGAAVAAAGAAGAAADGIRIEGPPAGFGGRLMRTVCFFCVASAGFGGSEPGAGEGAGLLSDIKRCLLRR